jgi:hypothetical protein
MDGIGLAVIGPLPPPDRVSSDPFALHGDSSGPHVYPSFMVLHLLTKPVSWHSRVSVSGGNPDVLRTLIFPVIQHRRAPLATSNADVASITRDGTNAQSNVRRETLRPLSRDVGARVAARVEDQNQQRGNVCVANVVESRTEGVQRVTEKFLFVMHRDNDSQGLRAKRVTTH